MDEMIMVRVSESFSSSYINISLSVFYACCLWSKIKER